MKLTFLGTRGEIEAANKRHRRHGSLLVTHLERRVMIDCGEDWSGQLKRIGPRAIIITHAHPDHAWGLKDGASCPVYATAEAWKEMKDYPVEKRETVDEPGKHAPRIYPSPP